MTNSISFWNFFPKLPAAQSSTEEVNLLLRVKATNSFVHIATHF